MKKVKIMTLLDFRAQASCKTGFEKELYKEAYLQAFEDLKQYDLYDDSTKSIVNRMLDQKVTVIVDEPEQMEFYL